MFEDEYYANTGKRTELFHKGLVGLRPATNKKGVNHAMVRNIINQKESKSAPKYSVSKPYMSDKCANYDEGNIGLAKYIFKFPSNWIADDTHNKAIGLRAIKIDVPSITIVFALEIKERGKTGPTEIKPYSQTFPVNAPTDRIFADIIQFVKKHVVTGDLMINYYVNTATFKFISEKGQDGLLKYAISFHPLNHYMKGWEVFMDLLNMPHESRPWMDLEGPNNEEWYTQEVSFHEVWNRHTLYLHASFVTDDTNKYLGQSGDFHDKITKLWEIDNPDREFTIWLSFDGVKMVELVNFFSIKFTFELVFFSNVSNNLSL